jgi:hypothetical protein
MMKIFRYFLITSLFTSTLAASSDSYQYPELQVRPLASQRVKMQAKKEGDRGLLFQPVMQVSAIATLTAGLLQYGNVDEHKDEDKRSPLIGTVVGASWLGINYFVGQKLKVYRSTLEEINKLPAKTNEDKLIRERIAEEGIRRAAKLSKRMKWLSVLTNVGANAYMLDKAEKDSSSEIFNAVSLAASLGPLLFSTEWEDIAKDQKKYKKRIYGPILTSSVFKVGRKDYAPGLLFSMKF